MLKDRIDPATVRRLIVEALGSHQNFAGGGAFESGNDAQQRGLA